MDFVVYVGLGRVFVTVPEREEKFKEKAKKWEYDLESDFRRSIVKDDYVMVETMLMAS